MSGTATVATAVRSCPAVVAVVAAVAVAAAVVSTAAAVVPDAALSSGQPEGGGGASYVGFPTNSASDTMPGGSPGAANASDPDYAPGWAQAVRAAPPGAWTCRHPLDQLAATTRSRPSTAV